MKKGTQKELLKEISEKLSYLTDLIPTIYKEKNEMLFYILSNILDILIRMNILLAEVVKNG